MAESPGGKSTLWLLLPSPIRALPADLFCIIGLTLTAGVTTLVPIFRGTLLQAAVGVCFIILAPGYALVSLLFPRGPTDGAEDSIRSGLDTTTRIVFASTLSIAVASLCGLVLVNTPWGMTRWLLVAVLGGLSLLLAVGAAYRRRQLPPAERFEIAYADWMASVRAGLSTDSQWDTALSVLTVLSLVIAITAVGSIVAFPKQDKPFTEFYILNETSDGELTADSYPQNFTVGESRSLTLGITNQERQPIEYTAVVAIQHIRLTNTSTTVLQTREIDRITTAVSHNETWTRAVSITPSTPGEQVRLEFLLYRGDVPPDPSAENAYESLRLWITVTSPG